MSVYNNKAHKICIISPSGKVNSEFIDGAIIRLKDWGHEVVEGKYAREAFGRYAGTEEQRIYDLQTAINDESISAILCARGGYGIAQIIDRIDFSPLMQNHKLLIGYSDISVIHAVLSNMNIPSVHAVMAKQITTLRDDSPSLIHLKSILEGKFPTYNIPHHDLNRTGSVKGKLIGGNLSVIAGLRGTPYDLNYENAILFIEDIGEEPYRIDRILQNFRLSGVFDKISGLIIGHFTDCNDDHLMNKTLMEIIKNLTNGYDFPVCFGFPAGHEDENYPLIMGKEVKFVVNESGVILDFN
jgi:muramoyltetrapeptide carboxypeptidase